MKKIMALAMLCSSLMAAAQNTNLYVAVRAGLNMREAPGTNASVIDKIPYGTLVTFLDDTEQMIAIKTEGLSGFWRKVKYNNKTGYVVDSYLFPVAPPNVSVKTLKDYMKQISVPFGNMLVVKGGNEEIGWQTDKQLFKNGAEWHQYHGYEYGSNTYFLPEFTMQQAFLLLRLVPEFADVIGSNDEFPRQNKKVKKGDVEHVIKVESEMITQEPWIKKITIEYETGAIYSFELYQIDNQVVVLYSSGV